MASASKGLIMECATLKDGRVFAAIKASPGASKTAAAGTSGGMLRIRIAAAPEDGKANEELCRYIAGILGCARGELRLEKGEKSRRKILSFPAAYMAQFEKAAGEGEAGKGGANKRTGEIKK
jgi:uncharacterized protein (TIGR00251 family)